MSKSSLAVLIALILAAGCADRAPEATAGEPSEAPRPFEGAWRGVEFTTTGPNGGVDSTGAEVRIFDGTHYAWLSADAGRAPVDSASTASALWTTYGTGFGANSGSFEVSGSELTFRPIVAKNPPVMAEGYFLVHSFRLAGDSLWLTQVRNSTGPIENPGTVKYVRMP